MEALDRPSGIGYYARVMRIPPSGPPKIAGYSVPGLKDAVAQSRKTGSPVLDAATMNGLLSNAPKAAHRALLSELVSNPASFVKAHFSLTKQQGKELAALTPSETNALRKGAQTAMTESLAVKADCGAARALDPGEQLIAKAGHFSITKVAAAPSGFAGTMKINMRGFAE